MSMNPNVIRDSFANIAPKAPFVMNQFYKNLFQMYPLSRELFQSTDMEKQKKQLTNALVFVVQNLENTETLMPALKDMGRRHAGYGVKEEHYNWVGSAMMKTLADYFESFWNDELKTNWEEALKFIARAMIEGSRDFVPKSNESVAKDPVPHQEVPQEPPTYRGPGVADTATNPVSEVDLAEFRQQARDWAKKIIKQEFESEMTKFLEKLKSA